MNKEADRELAINKVCIGCDSDCQQYDNVKVVMCDRIREIKKKKRGKQ